MAVFALIRTELIRASRRQWIYWLRTIYAAVLATLLLLAWVSLSGHAGEWQMRPQVGHRLFRIFSWAEYAVLQAVAVLSLAGAIAGERHHRTLPVLLSTRLSSFAILAGKWLAGLVPVALLLATGVPLACLLLVFGGFSLIEALAAKILILLVAVFAAALTLLCSTLLRGVTAVFLASSILLILFQALGLAVVGSPAHPLHVFARLLQGHTPPEAVWLPGAVLLALSFLLLGLASLLIRVVQADAGGREATAAQASSGKREQTLLRRLRATTVGMNPLFARECFRGWRNGAAYPAIWTGVPVLPVLVFSTQAQQAFWVPLLIGVTLLAMTIQAIRVFQRERMRGTLPVLLSIPAGRNALFRGGLLAAGWRGGWLACVPVGYVCIQYAMGRMASGGVVLVAVGSVLGYGFFVCALGYVAGMRIRRMGRALLAVGGVVAGLDLLLLGMEWFVLRHGDPAHAPQVTMLYWLSLPWDQLVLMPRIPGGVLGSWVVTTTIRVGVGVLILFLGQHYTDRLLGRIP